MILQRPSFHVITGGSGSGKSTLLAALQGRGFSCVPEQGRLLVQEQMQSGGEATPWLQPLKFRDLLLQRSVSAFEQAAFQTAAEPARPVFFDRGIPETIGYSRQLGKPVPRACWAEARRCRYAPTVFVTPPWREIYTEDAERRQDWAFAQEDYHVNVQAYADCGYALVEVPRVSVEERVTFVLKTLGLALG